MSNSSGHFHPRFERHDTGGGGTGDAQEPGVGGESVLFIFIRQRTGGEHQRSDDMVGAEA